MGELQTHIFAMIAALCFLFSFTVYIHFLYSITHIRTSKILRLLSTVSLTGYNAHILLSTFLFIYDSIYYITPQLPYHWLLCTSQTFNIMFFMIGKMAMYYFFLSLVHVAFRGSFIEYHKSILKSIAIIFTILMFLIFIIYTYSSYIDIQNIGIITSPIQCSQLSVSTLSSITIWTGSTMDASWSVLCLCLFYHKLRQLLRAMREISLSDMMSPTKSEISEFDHHSHYKQSLQSISRKTGTKTLKKRPSLHQQKSTPTRIIARASKLATIEHKTLNINNSSKTSPMTATGMGIGRTSGITPMITPFGNNSPKMLSMPISNRLRPSTLGQPTLDNINDIEEVINDIEDTVNIDSRRTTATATSTGYTMDKLNLSVSTPSITPIPLPSTSKDNKDGKDNKDNKDNNDNQVRFSALMDKSDTTSIEDNEGEKDEYTLQNVGRNTQSLFQSIIDEHQEYDYDGRQEMDEMGTIHIVYDDEYEEEEKLPEATLGETISDSMISNTEDNDNNDNNDNDNKQKEETIGNDEEKLPESTLRRVITDIEEEEEPELHLTDIEEEDSQIVSEVEITKIEHDKTEKSEIIYGENKEDDVKEDNNNNNNKKMKKKTDCDKIGNLRDFDSVASRTRSRSKSSLHMKRYVINQFLPIVFKLSLLSFWCAVSTVILGFMLWTLYPALSSLIDSTINGLCVYLAFVFAKPLYHILCLPFYSCSKCQEMRNILNEVENAANHNQQHSII